MQDGSKLDPRSWVLSNLSLIDRAWELHWALRLMQAIFFFDIAMRLTGSPGLVDWDSSVEAMTGNIGFILITFAAFTLSMTLVIPVVIFLFQQLLMASFIRTLCRLDHDPLPNGQRPRGKVTIWDLEAEGDRQNDPSFYQLAEEEKQQEQAIAAKRYKSITTMTGTFVMILLNAFPVIVTVPDGTILDELMHYINYGWSAYMIVILLVWLFAGILGMISSRFSTHWVSHRQLHLKLEEERRARIKERLAFEKQFTGR